MTPLFKKLNFKDHAHIVALNAPKSFDPALQEMRDTTTIFKSDVKLSKIEFIMIFVTKQSEIDEVIKRVFPKLIDDAVLWFCYPKGTSKKYTCDFNRDTGWSGLGKYNLDTVRQVAIDEDWSALRFRKVEYIKR